MNGYEDTDDAQVDGHVNNVSARVSGYVFKVNVDDNQYVEKGAVLVEIDPRDYQVAVENAKAELADAEATAQAMNLNVPVETIGTTTQVSSSEADLNRPKPASPPRRNSSIPRGRNLHKRKPITRERSKMRRGTGR